LLPKGLSFKKKKALALGDLQGLQTRRRAKMRLKDVDGVGSKIDKHCKLYHAKNLPKVE